MKIAWILYTIALLFGSFVIALGEIIEPVPNLLTDGGNILILLGALTVIVSATQDTAGWERLKKILYHQPRWADKPVLTTLGYIYYFSVGPLSIILTLAAYNMFLWSPWIWDCAIAAIGLFIGACFSLTIGVARTLRAYKMWSKRPLAIL